MTDLPFTRIATLLVLSLWGCVAGSEGPRGPGSPMEPEPGLRADLAPGPIDAPDQVSLDSVLEMRVGVRNHGSRSAGPGWFIRVFLSTDQAIDPADIQVDQFQAHRELPAGADDQYLRVRKLDRNTPAGLYFIGSILDATEVVPEVTEGNNTLVNPATIILTASPPRLQAISKAHRFVAQSGEPLWTRCGEPRHNAGDERFTVHGFERGMTCRLTSREAP